MDEYIGTIKIFAGDYAPLNYMKCEGQTLKIKENVALYSLLGTTYGGDKINTFMLPDLRGRLIIDPGLGYINPYDHNSSNLSYRTRGEKGGEEKVTLTLDNIPPHTHTYSALSGNRESRYPEDNYLGNTASDFYAAAKPTDTLVQMAKGAIGYIGGQAHENMPPFICLTYIICVVGLYPEKP